MKWTFGLTSSLLLAGQLFLAPAASADDFTLSKDVTDGTFSFTDSNASVGVIEVVVSGEGLTAGTTLPGWSAAAFLFDDPLDCLPAIGSTISSGFCYLLTDSSVGAPITGGTTTFTYDSSFDDPTLPSEFAVVFTESDGSVGACFGESGGGCSVPLPEPDMTGPFLMALFGVFVLTTGKRLRRRA